MKVRSTVTFSDDQRRLVARFLGKDSLATRVDMAAFVKCQAMTAVATLALAEEQKAARIALATAGGSIVMGARLE